MDAKSKGNNYTRYIRRVLMLAAAITSGTVLIFALTTIITTDEMARKSVDMYETGYDAMFSARTMQAGLLRVRRQVASYLMDPTLDSSRSTLSDIHQWQRQNVGSVESFRSLLSDAQYEELTEELLEVYSVQDEAVGAAQSGDLDGAMQLYNDRLKNLYESVDTLFEDVLSNGVVALREGAEYMDESNRTLNLWCLIFATGIVALSVITAWICGRRIEERSSDAYRKEVLFNFIARHADDVFEIYGFEEGRMTYVSENLKRVFGVPADQYVADNTALQEHIHPADRQELVDRYYDKNLKNVTSVEFRYKNPMTGREQILKSTIYPVIRDSDGELSYHVLLTRDISEDRHAQERIQDALNEAEYANKSRREFLSRMSHEIRTPINGIIGMQKVAMDSLDDRAKVRRCLEQIHVSAEHLKALVNDVLDMSKIESGRLELAYAPFDLGKLVSDLTSIMSQRIDSKRQTLEIDMDTASSKQLIGDELRLRQVLMNFLSNANKYTPEGGRIRLVVRQTEPKYGFTRTTFSVEDNGPGIPIDEVGRIFLPFERGTGVADRTSGAGLGLPISKHVIDEMGGSIWAESVEGEGSTFTFDVSLGVAEEKPQEKPDEPEEREDTDAAQPDQEQLDRCLLVVDDNDINLEVARELLKQAGYTVEEAYDGQEALDMFEKAPDGWYQAILMDIQMPVMDGRTATQRIRDSKARDGAGIPIFAMTADPFVADEASGFNGCFAKPVDADLILGTLKKAIRSAKKKTDDAEA